MTREPTTIAADGDDLQRSLDPGEVLRAIVAVQLVFTVGNVLTTGAFLYYFANALHPSTLWFSVLLVTPEVSETAAIWSRSVIRWIGSRKRTWLVAYILARVAALGIPAMAFPTLRPADDVAFWVLVGSLGLSHVFQSIAYTAYVSWLSDLAPRENWGGVFALGRIASVAVMVLLPAGATLLRQNWNEWTSEDAVRTAYLTVFLSGNVLLWLAIVPILRIPDVSIRWSDEAGESLFTAVAQAWRWRPLRYIVASTLWLSAAQGLTQGCFFSYQVNVLHLPLQQYLLLSGLMYALQIPGSWLGGWISDRSGDRRALIVGVVLVSGAMAFWLLAKPGAAHWLIGAYAVWGLFGVINVCRRNLLLKSAPPSDNALPIAMIEHLAGFVAGMAGLLGGWWLDRLQTSLVDEHAVWPYVVVFVVSWIGRATAALWLLPVPEPNQE